jgi:hypothetical protein
MTAGSFLGTLRLSKSEIHFSAFSNEYIKAPSEIAREERNIPMMASNFPHLVTTSPFHSVQGTHYKVLDTVWLALDLLLKH